MVNIGYDNCFNPYIDTFIKITLEREYSEKLKNAILKIINSDKSNHKGILNQEQINIYKKHYMQLAGDVVLEQHFGVNFIDWDLVNKSRRLPFVNNIINTKIDICTFSHGNFPLVYSNTYRDTIFICMLSKIDFYICGIGKPIIINSYSSSDLIKNEYLKVIGKSGFFGFYKLTPIPNRVGGFINLLKK